MNTVSSHYSPSPALIQTQGRGRILSVPPGPLWRGSVLRLLSLCPRLPDEMVPRAGDKVELGADAPAFMLQVRRLDAEVLRVLGVVGDPVQQPVVALILAGHLQGDHVMTPESHQPELGPFPGQRQGCAHPDKAKPSPKVRVVLQC